MTKNNIAKTLVIAGAMLGASSAYADTISPSSYSATLDVGASVTIKKTVTVSAGRPTTARADIFFLTDTTGSMGGTISTVKSNFGAIAAGLSGDIAFGVGQYKDVGDIFAYNLDQDITTSVSAAQTAINTWGASGGGDTPEAAFYALSEVATTTSWRAGAKKIVLIAADAPSNANGGVDQAGAVSALTKNGVIVESIDVGGMNSFGQFDGASSIYADGVAGDYFTTFGSDLVTTIDAAIGAAFTNYSNVTLGISGVPAGVGVSFTPIGGISGLFDRSIDRSFDFDITFPGLTAGSYDFSIYGLVDGGIVATESDRIVVTGGAVPEPTTWAMMICGMAAVGSTMRRRKTAISFA